MVSNREFASMAEWQAALDDTDFLVPLRLGALNLDGPEPSHAILGDRRVDFVCERRNFDEVKRKPGIPIEGPWSVCYACQGFGLFDVVAAGAMVRHAFVARTGGAFFNPCSGIGRYFAPAKVELDCLIAVALDRQDLLHARYPEIAAQEKAWAEQDDPGNYTIITRVWKGDPPEVASATVKHYQRRKRN